MFAATGAAGRQVYGWGCPANDSSVTLCLSQQLSRRGRLTSGKALSFEHGGSRIIGATLLALSVIVYPAAGLLAQVPAVGPAGVPIVARVSGLPPTDNALVELSGVARTTENTPVRFAPMRLRDASTGKIVGYASSDPNGAFTFGTVRSGYYVVEITDQAGRVLATSPLVSANAGDVVSTLIKLPTRFLMGGLLGSSGVIGAGAGGSSMAGLGVGAIAAVTSAAASAGVMAFAATARPASPEQ